MPFVGLPFVGLPFVAPQLFHFALAQEARLLVHEPPMASAARSQVKHPSSAAWVLHNIISLLALAVRVDSKFAQRRAVRDCRAWPGARCLRRPRRRAGLRCWTRQRSSSSHTRSPRRCGHHIYRIHRLKGYVSACAQVAVAVARKAALPPSMGRALAGKVRSSE